MKVEVATILNPAAGRGRAHRARAELERALAAQGGRLVTTVRPGEATELAAAAVREGARLVVAAGGDGTLREVAIGVSDSSCEIGLIPLGTGNDFARAMGIPLRVRAALAVLATGVPTPIDLGTCGGGFFVNVCGCGFDAEVAERINRGIGWARGTFAYLLAVAASLARFRPSRARIERAEGITEMEAMLVAVANGTCYGGGMRIAPSATPRDGLLDVVAIGAMGRGEFVRHFASVFRGEHVRHPKVRTWRTTWVRVASERRWSVLADGEVIGRTPIEFGLRPSAIVVRLPAPAVRAEA